MLGGGDGRAQARRDGGHPELGNGQVVRKDGRGNVRKTGDGGGLFSEIGFKKGQFLAKKAGEKAIFCVRKVKLGGPGGVFGPEADIMS